MIRARNWQRRAQPVIASTAMTGVSVDCRTQRGTVFHCHGAFKSGERSGPIMRTMARSLSNEEIAILARYFAARGKETQRR